MTDLPTKEELDEMERDVTISSPAGLVPADVFRLIAAARQAIELRERVAALIPRWRARMEESEQYKSPDVEAAGLAEAADELEAALSEPQ